MTMSNVFAYYHKNPNPNSGSFNIYLNKQYKTLKTEVTDVLGKIVYTSKEKETNTLSLNLNIPKGLYFVSITTEEGRINKKVVVE